MPHVVLKKDDGSIQNEEVKQQGNSYQAVLQGDLVLVNQRQGSATQ